MVPLAPRGTVTRISIVSSAGQGWGSPLGAPHDRASALASWPRAVGQARPWHGVSGPGLLATLGWGKLGRRLSCRTARRSALKLSACFPQPLPRGSVTPTQVAVRDWSAAAARIRGWESEVQGLHE
jgi:hypothetical protein